MNNLLVSNIKYIRKHKGLSQNKMALIMGIPLRSYQRYELKETQVNLNFLDKFCKVNNIPIELMFNKENLHNYLNPENSCSSNLERDLIDSILKLNIKRVELADVNKDYCCIYLLTICHNKYLPFIRKLKSCLGSKTKLLKLNNSLKEN